MVRAPTFRPFAARGRRPVVAILLTIALSSALGVGLSVRSTKNSAHRATVIQIAARQRTLAERYVNEILLVQAGKDADPAEIASVLRRSAHALLDGGLAPSVNGDDDETVLPGEHGSLVRRQLEQERRLIGDLTATGSALLAGRRIDDIPLTAHEHLSPSDPLMRLRTLAALSSNVSFNVARTIGTAEDHNINHLITLQVGLGIGGLLTSLLLAGALIAATRRQTAHFRSLVSSSTDLVFVLGAGGCRYVSRSVSQLVGRPEGDLFGSGVFSFVHEIDRPSLRSVGSHGIPRELVFRLRNAAGELRQVEAHVTDLRDDRHVRGVVLNARDITERLRAERAALESAERLRALVDASPLAIVAVDAQGLVSMWSDAATAIFGWTAEEAVGAPPPFIPAGEDAEMRALLSRVLAGERLDNVQLVRSRKDGAQIEVLLSAAPLRDAFGVIVGAVGVFVDVTERCAVEQRLQQSERLEAIGRLAGGVAHDFNNLLMAIGGHSALALSRLPEDASPKLHESVSELGRCVERAAALTQRLLAFGRQQVLQPEAVDPGESIRSLERMLRPALRDDISLTYDLPAELPSIEVDRAQLEHALVNLVLNAADAMPRGGDITMRAERDARSRVTAMGGFEIPPGDYVRIAVSDTGTGIPRELIPKLFEPFFTTKRVGEGTGLGLASVYGFVKQTGGFVWAESTPGTGSAFTMLLPTVEADAKNSHYEPPAKQLAAGSGTILVVDDEPAVRSVVAEALKESGYRVVVAEDGNAALAVAAAHDGPIDLIVTDVVMPGIGGVEAAKQVTTLKPGVRCLYMSGYSEDVAAANAVLEGAYFLQKPFSLAALTEAVRHALNGTGGTRNGS